MSRSGAQISVAISTRGRPHYLRRALASVASQSRLPDELVVSEDGVDRRVAAVVAEISDRVRVRHFANDPPLGQLENQRHAFELTQYELFAMLHDDDEWEPGFLASTSEALVAHPECGFCSTDHYLIDDEGRVLPEASRLSSARFGRLGLVNGVYDDVLVRHLRCTTFSLHSTLFRREVIEPMGFLPKYGGQNADFALFLELGTRRIPAYYLAENLGRYRVHQGQATKRPNPAATEATARCLRTIGERGGLKDEERQLLAARFRGTVVEIAVGYARRRERRAALKALRRYTDFGIGLPSARRLVVLAALLAGVRPRATRPTRPS